MTESKHTHIYILTYAQLYVLGLHYYHKWKGPEKNKTHCSLAVWPFVSLWLFHIVMMAQVAVSVSDEDARRPPALFMKHCEHPAFHPFRGILYSSGRKIWWCFVRQWYVCCVCVCVCVRVCVCVQTCLCVIVPIHSVSHSFLILHQWEAAVILFLCSSPVCVAQWCLYIHTYIYIFPCTHTRLQGALSFLPAVVCLFGVSSSVVLPVWSPVARLISALIAFCVLNSF